ncbi:unnamed protein product, partial [Brenthis ino]
MKTIIVLCSIAAFATAIPTLIKGTLDELESEYNKPSVTIKREKKSPLHDPLHEEILNNEKENSHIDTGIKSHIVAPAFEGRSLGFKKPLIIKKKFGYHLYRDSDEEMTYADPHEKCRKQVKVKLCDEEPSVSSKNFPKGLTSARLDGHISEREVEHSIKMAKEAVENLQRDIQKIEQSSAKLRETPRNANLATDAEVQEDIEVARKALEHITHNFENFESMEIHAPRTSDMLITNPTDEERLAQWKDAIENIHRNFEIARNIEDAFRSESLDTFSLDNSDATKLTGNPLSVIEHQIQEKSNDELLDNKSALTKDLKTLRKEENVDFISNLEKRKSSTANEQQLEENNDMFTSTTNNKEFKMELHSDSLKKEKTATDSTNNNIDKEALTRHETRMDESSLDGHLSEMKNAESLTHQSGESKTLNNELQMMKNALPEVNHENMESHSNEDVEHKETFKLAREVEMENVNLNKKDMKKEHENSLTSSNTMLDQTHAETKALSDSDTVRFENDEVFMPKETLPFENIIKDPSHTHIHDLREKSTEEHMKEFLLNDKEGQDIFSMRASHDSAALFKENKHHNEELHTTSQDDDVMRLAKTVTNDYTNEQVKSFPTKIDSTIEENKHKSAKMSQEENIVQKLTENNDLHTLSFIHANENNDDLTQQFKTVSELDRKSMVNDQMRMIQDQNTAQTLAENHQLQLKSASDLHNDFQPTTDLKSGQNVHYEQASMRMTEDKPLKNELAENNNLHDSHFMRFAQVKEHNDHLLPAFKVSSEFQNGQSMLTSRTNLMENSQKMEESMIEDKNRDHKFNQNLNSHTPLVDGWSEDRQRVDHLSSGFKSATDFHKGHSLMPLTIPTRQHSGQNMHKEETNMRMSEGMNLEQQFHDNQGMHDAHSMTWTQDNQHKHLQSQHFNNVPEFHNHHFRPHMHHQHGFVHTNRFGNQFDLDSNNNLSPLSSRTNDHGKLSELDSSMQPSSHLNMRDNGVQWNHHHHGMSRSSYGSSLPIGGYNQGAVGIFPNANTACGIPLMLSCSPSVVSGSLAKPHPTGITAPAYRSGDDIMFYMKRDTKNTDETPLKIQKTPSNHKTELTLNKQ